MSAPRDGAVQLDAVKLDAVPIDAVPIDAVPIDAVPIDAVPIDAVQSDAVQATRPGPEEFRATMRSHAAGVSVITTYRDGPVGFCATSLSSVSLNPPIVSFAVSCGSASGRAWSTAEHGIVHLLNADQAALALSFARPGFGAADVTGGWRFGPHGQPLLDHVPVWMVIRCRTRLRVGDHLLVVCDVLQATVEPGPGPLVHHAGSFYGLRGFAA